MEWRQATNVAIAIVALLLTFVFIMVVWVNRFDPVLTNLVVKNFPAIIGLPFAFIAAFVVVALFRQSEHPVEFEGIGFKLKGAAGEVILWLLCFAVISAAIGLLWRN